MPYNNHISTLASPYDVVRRMEGNWRRTTSEQNFVHKCLQFIVLALWTQFQESISWIDRSGFLNMISSLLSNLVFICWLFLISNFLLLFRERTFSSFVHISPIKLSQIIEVKKDINSWPSLSLYKKDGNVSWYFSRDLNDNDDCDSMPVLRCCWWFHYWLWLIETLPFPINEACYLLSNI